MQPTTTPQQSTRARTHFAVVEDRDNTQQIPIGPERATPEEAQADLERLKADHPEAYVHRCEGMDKDCEGVELNRTPPAVEPLTTIPLIGELDTDRGSPWTAQLCWGFFRSRPEKMPARFLRVDQNPDRGWLRIHYLSREGHPDAVVWSGLADWNHPLFALHLGHPEREQIRSALMACYESCLRSGGPMPVLPGVNYQRS